MEAKLFNAGWKFWEIDNSFSLVPGPPADAKVVNLPHDAMIEFPQSKDAKSGTNTGYRRGGIFGYAKSFYAESADKNYILKIEGAYMNAFVYVNDQLAAKRPYGYSVFYVPLNKFLNFGAENEIQIQVRAGAEANSRWYSGAGLYRDVYMLEAGKTYIVPDSVRIDTEAAVSVRAEIGGAVEDASKAEIILSGSISDNCLPQEQSRVSEEILLYERDLANESAGECKENSANDTASFSAKIKIPSPKLWDVDTPYLYTCTINLKNKAGEILDSHTESFGIRSLSLSPEKGLLINGKSVKLKGACIHHDSGMLGAKTYEAVHERQIKILKEAGFNAIRCAHNPAAPALLRACDKVGMLVMDEAFDMWTRHKSDYDYAMSFSEWWERDIEAMVKNDYNHPSVIMYSIGNEIPETCSPEGIKICRAICEKIHSMDPARYTVNSINGFFSAGKELEKIVAEVAEDLKGQGRFEGSVNDFMAFTFSYLPEIVGHPIMDRLISGPFEYTDIAGYNYMGSRYEKDAALHPERIVVGSETGIEDIAFNWPLVKKYPNIIGDFCWTGWDYLGEAGIGVALYNEPGPGLGNGAFPTQISGTGCIDITGVRTPMSYYREIVFGQRKDPYIAVQDPAHYGEVLIKTPWIMTDAIGSWSFKDYIGEKVVIEVYSGGCEVELFLNGVSLGKKPAGESCNYRTLFETEYMPGTLTAVSYEGGKESGRYELKSADFESTALKIKEDFRFPVEGGEIVYYNLEISDKDGVVDAGSDEVLKLMIPENCRKSGCPDNAEDNARGTEPNRDKRESGAGLRLLAFGSAEPMPYSDYSEPTARTFRGRAQLIVEILSENV